jgi:hypothetical protein
LAHCLSFQSSMTGIWEAETDKVQVTLLQKLHSLSWCECICINNTLQLDTRRIYVLINVAQPKISFQLSVGGSHPWSSRPSCDSDCLSFMVCISPSLRSWSWKKYIGIKLTFLTTSAEITSGTYRRQSKCFLNISNNQQFCSWPSFMRMTAWRLC